MTDDILVQRLARGDSTALWLIYERHRGVVFRFLYRMAGSRERAEDVTHDTFVALMLRPQAYDPKGASLRTYLCAIARNIVRADKRRRRFETEWPADLTARLQAPANQLHSALRTELAARVQDAVLSLAPLLREVLVLVEYEGFTLAETAAVVGTRVGTVKTRLHRARRAMREKLANYLGSSDAAVRRHEQ